MATIDTSEIMTTAQAATKLGLARDSVQKLCTRGLLAAQKAGRDWLIPHTEVARYLAERRGVGRPPKE